MAQGSSPLTDAFLSSVKATGKQVEYPDAKTPGLGLRVSAKGRKAWTFRYRTAEGRQRRLSLGSYPAIPLAKARRLAIEALGQAQDGKDPVQERREKRVRAGLKAIRTVSDLATDYFQAARRGRHRAEARPKRESTLALEEDYFDRLIKPKFGAFDVDHLMRPDVQRFLDDLASSSPSAARQCRNVLRQMFNYAIRREITDRRNPAQFTDVPRSQSRERVVSEPELKAIWRTCSRATAVKLSQTVALAIKFVIVTLQRGSEICGATRGEFDFEAKVWTIPGERTKNHRTHVVPLSEMAMGILKEVMALPVHRGHTPDRMASDRALFTATQRGKPVTRRALTRAMKRITAHLNISDVTPHDFRRTGSTAMTSERLGVPRFHVSYVLNHMSDTGGAAAVTGVYDRNTYLPERRRALEKWACRLTEIVNSEPS